MASPEGTGKKEGQGCLIALSCSGKRKRSFTDPKGERPHRTPRGVSVTDPLTVGSDSELDVPVVDEQQAAAGARFSSDEWLNDILLNDMLKLFSGIDAQSLPSYSYVKPHQPSRSVTIAKDAHVTVLPMNINNTHWVATAIEGRTGKFKFYNSLSPFYTEEIVGKMKHFISRVTNMDLEAPEEVVC